MVAINARRIGKEVKRLRGIPKREQRLLVRRLQYIELKLLRVGSDLTLMKNRFADSVSQAELSKETAKRLNASLAPSHGLVLVDE